MPFTTRHSTQDDVEIGARLREARKASGRSQQKLAKEMGISYQQLQKYEGGQSRLAAAQAVYFCDVLGLTLDELLRGPARQTPATPAATTGSPCLSHIA